MTKRKGYKSLQLKVPNGEDWTLEEDSHWSCFGHKQIAKQVSFFINKLGG